MTTHGNDSKNDGTAPDAREDVTSDPAAAAEDNDWSSEGGAVETGPATDDERTAGN
ncbi:hypothetical protein MTX35_20140 [Rhodococcus sp. ARC_M12]|uniref:hypothetical protein n=1 Tax=Rhodococcus sp. ARC_M12 TaxID=2928854 RepID=UPI001FB2E204|nr:hypothetical protein [Rhodococcus sp. ARC_M12]MCJ0980025.1 hypothetical protein [Rhodococcus sp. ARC_M12]